jgi:hypothetical protein
LKRGSQAAGRSAGSQELIQHRHGAPEGRVAEERVGISKIRVIQSVKRLDSQLRLPAFGDRELPLKGEIELRHSESGNGISAKGAGLKRIRHPERGTIQDASAGNVGCGNPERLAGQ